MKILWFTWKDRTHPLTGGAEVVAHEVASRLVRDGHEVIFIVAGYENCVREEVTSYGYKVVRLGNRYSVYYYAWNYYRAHLRGWADQVIDELNAIPFFAVWYVTEPVTLLVHHITGTGWLYQISFPLNILGLFLEPVMLLLISHSHVITVSESTKTELIQANFNAEKISTIPEGIDCPPVATLDQVKKYSDPTLLFVGSIRPLKRPTHVVEAFETAKQKIPNLKLKIAGPLDDGGTGYGKKFKAAITDSKYADAIEYLGRVSSEEKIKLMQQSHIICVTSRKEGWGLIVTEANSQGTPAIVYNVPGLRDSTRDGITGVICKENTPGSLAQEVELLFGDSKKYSELQKNAWEWSKEFTFEKTYLAFIQALKKN